MMTLSYPVEPAVEAVGTKSFCQVVLPQAESFAVTGETIGRVRLSIDGGFTE